MIDRCSIARSRGGIPRHGSPIRFRHLLFVFALLLAVSAHARAQGALPEAVDLGTIVDLNTALNDAFNADLEDICRCRNVAGATRFERMVDELAEMEEAISPDRIREGLLDEGIDIPVEPEDTARTYLERERSTRSWTSSHPPLRERLRELHSTAEDLERVRENRGNEYDPDQPPPNVDREVEILRVLREVALTRCREDSAVPPPPDDRSDFREGLLIDLPREGPAPETPTKDRLREALLHELRNLCCKIYGYEALGAWLGNATIGLDQAPPDVQATAREYRELLGEVEVSMRTRRFHDLVLVEGGLARRRCDDATFESYQAGLVIDLGEGVEDASEEDPPAPPEPAEDPPDPEVADEPPPGFRHVTRGSNPSRHMPESNHVAEGSNASARVRDFFEEGREVPHVEDGVFTDRHLTSGEHASQFAPPERHVAEGPEASTLKGDVPEPPEGERHLTRGPGATSYVPEDRHVTEGSGASGLKPGGGGAGETDDEDEETDEDEEDDETDETETDEDEPVEDADDDGALAENPEDYTPDELVKASLARALQRMILELEPIQTQSRRRDTGDIEVEPKFIESRSAPGGWGPDRPEPADPMIYLTSLGVSTGEAFRVHVVSDEPVDLRDVVVAEAVAVPERDRRRIEAHLRAVGATSFTADGYCLEFERAVPPAGTMYRLAPREVQSAHAPVRRILAASRHLRHGGALAPDSDPESYFHSVRQWAIWTFEQGFDEEGFEDAFVSRTRENFRSAGAEWNDEVEGAVRSLVPNRWRDVQAILREAGR